MRKVILIPSFNDKEKLYWINKIPSDFDYIIYEKIPGLNKEITITKNHKKIQAIGPAEYALLYHIVKNYDNLEDVIVFTKVHFFNQCILFFEGLKECDKNLFFNFKNNIRKFVNVSGETYKKYIEKYNQNENFKKHRILPRDKTGSDVVSILMCGYSRGPVSSFEDFKKISLYKFWPYKKFCSYENKITQQEGVFSVKKELIHSLGKNFWNTLLNFMVETPMTNPINQRDSWCWFLFWLFTKTQDEFNE